MAIERFLWTDHAVVRLNERRLRRDDVELAIRQGHALRRANAGQADWLIAGVTPDGSAFEAIYDHPVRRDETTARIVSVWRVS